MADGYKPPFTITEEITNLVIEIGELTGAITLKENMSTNLILRRENRIRSIHSSLAIEQNTLTIEQVSDIINGKRVLGPPQDIREVQNAYEAYEMLTNEIGISERQVERIVKGLRASGKIQRIGANKGGCWQVNQ